MIEQFRDAFLEEARDLLESIEEQVLALDKDRNDSDTLNALFRVMHSLKGSSSMFGLDVIASLTHGAETVLDLCRAGKTAFSAELADLVLRTRDLVMQYIDNPDSDLSTSAKALETAFEAYRERAEKEAEQSLREARADQESFAIPVPAAVATKGSAEAVTGQNAVKSPASPAPGHETSTAEGYTERICRIRFEALPDFYRNGARVEPVFSVLRSLGTLTAHPDSSKVPALSALVPDDCHLSWNLVLATSQPLETVRDVFIFVEDRANIGIDCVDAEVSEVPRLGDILLERGKLGADQLQAALDSQKRLGQALLDSKAVVKADLESALAEQEQVRQVKNNKEIATLRVRSARLDELMNLVGELVTLHAQLEEGTRIRKHDPVRGITEQIGRISAQLRNNTMSMRLVPLASLLGKFNRLVHDLSRQLSKQARLVISGAETEIDKSMMERLNDPLVHLLRNCMDHGLESTEERLRAGKPAEGTVWLEARHSGAAVVITIRDDGAGINALKVAQRARDRGLVPEGKELSRDEILNLIFLPGFSTASQVSNVSGRGVGMDVVRTEIESLGGMVKVESEPGQGTAVTLSIPLTLAIIDGFLVKAAESMFVLPLQVVEQCYDDVSLEHNGLFSYRGKWIELLSLRQFFALGGEETSSRTQVVVVSTVQGYFALVVDVVIGGRQVVVKPLGEVAHNIPGISEGTILSDGTIGFILDVNRMAGSHRKTGSGQVEKIAEKA